MDRQVHAIGKWDLLICDIAQCCEVPGGSFCEDDGCSQKKVWERRRENH